MGRGDTGDVTDKWCILRTASVRTLPLARSLVAAGFDVWTPTRAERRTGRGRKRKTVEQVDVAITPTFVFARAAHKAELLRIRELPVSPHPPFRLLRHGDRIPLVSDAGLSALRAAEERFRLSALKSTKRRLEVGTPVRMAKGAFAGMTGVVEGGTDREATVNFGHGFTVSIASYLFETDVIRTAEEPSLGVAA